MKLIIYTIFLALGLSACEQEADKENEHTKVITTVFKIDPVNYTILEYEPDWDWIFKEAKPATLTLEELTGIEEIIEKSIVDNNRQQKEQLTKHNLEYPDNKWTETGYEIKDLRKFKRQYVSVINSKGEKEVWVNFFCDDWDSNKWRTEILIVHDGGNCYFNLKVNLNTKSYSEFSVNGYA